MVDKEVLRKVYLEKRLTLSKDEYEYRNELLVSNFTQHINLHTVSCIHLFLPIKSKKEVDTWGLLKAILNVNREIKFATSKTLQNGRLSHYQIRADSQFKVNKWGIPEPVNTLPIGLTEVDMVLIPLIVFDISGHRLGYGKGYYDRFLADLPQVKKIGLTLGPPLDKIDYVQQHDIQMDACVSPFKFYEF